MGTWVLINGTWYKLSSPDFRPVYHSHRSTALLGPAHRQPKRSPETADWRLAGQPGNDLVESMAPGDAVSHFVAAESVGGVGGMYPCVKIDHRGVGCLGVNQTLPKGRFTLLYDASRIAGLRPTRRRGVLSKLLRPWEIDASRITIDKRFDDWWDANVDFNPLRGQRF